MAILLYSPVTEAKNTHHSINLKEELNNSFRARVYFSNEVPVNGVAKEGRDFFIDPAYGSFLYVVVDNYPNNLNVSQLNVKVYKTEGLQNKMVEEKTYDINGSLYYTYIKYTFHSAGSYTFDIYTAGGEFLGSGNVILKQNTASPAALETRSNANTTSYAKSRVYFSTDVPSYGVAKDIKAFKLKPGGGFVYTIVDNYPNNFNVSSLKVYMYKLVGSNYIKRDEATYNIDGGYYFTFFKYTFNESGDYKFVVYDVNNKYVNTGYVKLTWE
jgi:hypothetical protein